MVLTTVGGIGYILLATVESVGVRYFGVFLAASGIFPSEQLNSFLDNRQSSNALAFRYRKYTALGNEYVLSLSSL